MDFKFHQRFLNFLGHIIFNKKRNPTDKELEEFFEHQSDYPDNPYDDPGNITYY